MKIRAVCYVQVPVLSVIFGTLPEDTVKALQRNGTVVVGTATCVDEAQVLEGLGFDAVVAQGSDAGGHRGSFLEHATLVGTMSLVRGFASLCAVCLAVHEGIAQKQYSCAVCLVGGENWDIRRYIDEFISRSVLYVMLLQLHAKKVFTSA